METNCVNRMNRMNRMITSEIALSQEAIQETKQTFLKFDIFKGIPNKEGKIVKIRTMGSATIAVGSSTYHLRLRSLLDDAFYLLPETKNKAAADYSILTREPSLSPPRKHFWHRVGEAKVMTGDNHGLMALEWDLFPEANIYMNLYPIERTTLPANTAREENEALEKVFPIKKSA